MPDAMPLPLAEWESFYVIIGSSAAALTGLQFVVVALGAEARRLAGPESLEAFGTPTVVHFCAVLLIAAILSTPKHTSGTLSFCLLACGIAGLAYAVSVVRQARRQKGYAPVLSDWVWHGGLPILAYASFGVSGVIAVWRAEWALYVVAATSLLLLFIGIHNAWDAAVWITTPREPEQPGSRNG